jgi:tetratricopeptide (TPR) repeat protein
VPERSGTVFVGRDRDLAELVRVWEEAAAGRGRTVLIGGEPGIGKTRLADELVAIVRAKGGRVLWGRGWQDAGAPAYWPWVQILRALLRSVEAEGARADPGADLADLATIAREVSELTGAPHPAPSDDPDIARFRLFDSISGSLVLASASGPILLVLDDLHAMDTPSLLLLRFVSGSQRDSPLLIVATYRDLGLGPSDPLAETLGELAREPTVRLLTLGGLDADAIADLVEAGGVRRPDTRTVTALGRRTGGNPLFLKEATRLLRTDVETDPRLDTSRLVTPIAIREVIERRIGHIDAAVADSLRRAAALGPEFDAERLGPLGPYSAEVLDELLTAAVNAGILTEVGPSGRFRFTHDLIRQALYDGIPPAARRRLHRQIAASLEAGPSSPAHLPELAYHTFAGLEGGDSTMAVRYAEEAGRAAASALAYEEASRLFRMALEALRLGGDDDRTACELLLSLGDSEARAGGSEAAREVFLEAAAIARRLRDGARLARAALGYGGRFVWTRAGADPHLVPLLREALDGLDGAEPDLEVRALARLACAYRSSPSLRDASDELTARALRIARRLGDPATLSYALVGRFWATYWPENPAERLDIAHELVAVADGANDAERAIDGHWALYLAYTDLGRQLEARAELAIVERAARGLRQPTHVWPLETYETVLALLEGPLDRAEALVEAEIRPHEVNLIRDGVSTTRIHRFLLRREQGRSGEEEATVRESIVEFPWYPFHRAALALLLVDTGRLDEARVVFDELAHDRFAALYRDCEWFLGMGLVAEACVGLRDAASADVLYDQLRPFAGRHAVAHAEGSLGCIDRYLGLLAACSGRLDVGVDHLEAAIEMNLRLGARPWAAHAQADLADVLRQRAGPGDEARAEALEASALEAATASGLTALHDLLLERQEPRPDTRARLAAGASGVGQGTAALRREGEYWHVRFGADSFTLRDAKGIRYLALLLATPGREIPSLDLVRLASPTGPSPQAPRGPVGAAETDAHDPGDAGEVIDAAARQAYRARLTEIDREIGEAEDWHDPERAALLREERAMLVHELVAAVGLGGRPRRVGSGSERARMSVTKAIRGTLRRIDACSRPLGDHLALSVRTGTFCSYTPDPGLALTWDLD